MQSTIEAAGIRSHLQRCFRRPPRPPWVRVRPTCERRGRGKQQEVSETAALQLDGQEASSEDVSGRKPCLGHPGPQGSCLYRCRQVSVPRPWWSHEVTRGDTGPFTARNRAFNIVPGLQHTRVGVGVPRVSHISLFHILISDYCKARIQIRCTHASPPAPGQQ